MEEFINLLKNESSTNGKMQILKDFASKSEIIREALKLCYDPFIISNIKKINVPMRSGTRSFESAFYEFKALFENLNSRSISGNAAQLEVSNFLSTIVYVHQEIFINILKKDLRVKIGAALINNALGENFIPQFEIQLANKYDPNKNYKVDYWWYSPKLNGLRGYYDSNGFNSRKGHRLYGFDHIEKELHDLCSKYSFSFCDGELYDFGIPFQTIQSYVTTKKNIVSEHKEKIKFNIFAIGNFKNTDEMILNLNAVDWNQYSYIKPLEYDTIDNNPNDIYQKMLYMYDNGYEGLMLRHPEVSYVYKRGNELLKAKPFKEASFVIVGFEEGKEGTNTEGTLGAIVIEGNVEGKKIKSKVGSGFKTINKDLSLGMIKTIEEGTITRDMIWNNREKFLGKTCEIQYQEVTDKPDPKTGMYSLQFPVFVYLKKDR